MALDGSRRHPSQNPTTQPPRKLNVTKFAESRAAELESLHAIVSDRLGNDFRSNRSKRRRTTSHLNRIGRGKRGNKKQKLSGVDGEATAALPRRVRRRIELKKNDRFGFSVCGDGTKRLRTHVWHAKRFCMTKLWGFYLPLGLPGRGRGSRAVLKWFREGALVHDASYYSAVQLEGSEDALLSILKTVMEPTPSALSEDTYLSILSGANFATAMLHNVDTTVSHPVGPVTYMWRPSHWRDKENGDSEHSSDGCVELQDSGMISSSRQVWVWIHAAAFSEGFDALKSACQKQMDETGIVACLSLEGQLAKLEITGSRAFPLIQKTLHPLFSNSENSWQLNKCSFLKAGTDLDSMKPSILANEENISPCSALSFSVGDPRLMPKEETVEVPESTSISDNNVPDKAAKGDVGSPVISEGNNAVLPYLLSMMDNASIFSDDRSLWDASSRVSPPLDESVLCTERHRLRKDFFCFDDSKSCTTKTSPGVQGCGTCPILLLKDNNANGSLSRWSVILPLSWTRVFWLHFVSKGAHAIGLREKRWIASNVGLPYFPSDFPDCDAYVCSMASERAAHDQKAEQQPPDVRPFKVPIPPPWDCVKLAFDSEATAVPYAQVRIENVMIDGNSLSNSRCLNTDAKSLQDHSDLFNGIVARTSRELIGFLNEIHCYNLHLFPQIQNAKTKLLECMKNERTYDSGNSGMDQIPSDRKICFVRVLLRAYKDGVFEEGAVVCAPSLGDEAFWTPRSENFEGGLKIPQAFVRLYFNEQSSGNWELHVPEEPDALKYHRWPIGFITTGFVRGSKKPGAVAFCDAVLLARLREQQWNKVPGKQRKKEIYVLVRNLRSSAYRVALATIVLEKQEVDVEFL